MKNNVTDAVYHALANDDHSQAACNNTNAATIKQYVLDGRAPYKLYESFEIF